MSTEAPAHRGRLCSTREADRWIAATAMWLGVPLLAHDRIFTDVPRLDLLTQLDR